jgi:predicted metal-dependent peptidase
MENVKIDIRNALTKARVQLLLKHPFWGNLALYLDFKEDQNMPFPLGTDYEYIFYNPKLLKDWTIENMEFGIAHEIGHCAFDHFGRRGNRKKTKWNIATDCALNPILIKNNVGEAPKGILYDPQYDNMCAEAIYDKLPDPP